MVQSGVGIREDLQSDDVVRHFDELTKKIQWKDVAEFERRELLKMRVHHALRKASTAILARF